MVASIDYYTSQLRHKTKFWLVNGHSDFIKENSNPFGKDQVPIMCDFLGEHDFPSFEAYESGNRSILLPYKGGWFKAKGIGIPTGLSRPIYDASGIYTYQLYNDPDMCHKSILWGFMQEEEYICELYGANKAKELGQNIELIGKTSFKNVYYLQLKNRSDMFDYLRRIGREQLVNGFKKERMPTIAYSTYYQVPSDIRVGELFYVLMFPDITKLIDPDLIKEYVQWLGFSCGHLLRQFHDSGALHGTWLGTQTTSLGLRDVHSNSYTGNYLVDEEGLTMCDFDLSNPVEDESEKELEKWALVHVENPLYYAGSYRPKDALNQRIAKKNPFREELATLFEQSVDQGYRKEPYEITSSLKKDLLGLLVKAKKLMWMLYGLPEDLTGNIYYVDYVISNKKIKNKEFREAAHAFQT